ncbi:phage protein NinX family protein [Pseudomonas sp. BN607]|uniref:phage protein NinX family protein n=1 Tax=Pseudomonas sp. BN607 TaxID=2567895 RepID=UPI002454AD14|nr:phage protein NinX family protein [Pseudomonas sp. BN607]MDH4550864.1 DUF2591 domain-containing protein [Pseudomonas sp. BN607]
MTDLIEVKTADLAGEALGWAVGKAEGLDLFLEPPGYNGVPCRVFARYQGAATEHTKRYNPWEDWAVGGPLFDKHCKGFGMLQDGTNSRYRAFAYNQPTGFSRLAGGPTILAAGCRAIVALHIGDTVQVPKELMP